MSASTVEVKIIDGGRGIRLVSQGAVTGETFVRVHQAVADAAPGVIDDVRYWFSDHSLLSAVHLRGMDAAAVAEVGLRLVERLPHLVVVNLARGDLEYGMLRVWEARSAGHGWPTETVRRAEEVAPALERLLGEAVDPFSPDVLQTLVRR